MEMDFRFNDMFEDHRGLIYYYVSPLTQIDLVKFGWPEELQIDNTHLFVEVGEKEFVYFTEEEIMYYLKYLG